MISSSIRDNILLGQPFKEKRYRKVLSASDLDVDIALLPAGDLTEVGDNGMLLSGIFKNSFSDLMQTISLYLRGWNIHSHRSIGIGVYSQGLLLSSG